MGGAGGGDDPFNLGGGASTTDESPLNPEDDKPEDQGAAEPQV
jgi:hypothetical protein